MSSCLALIPARGGSKGIPRKNIRSVGGKPMIAWTLEAALRSNKVNKVIVSTDDNEIAMVARRFGGEVPFMRPLEISGDQTPSIDVVLHALSWVESHEKCIYDYLLFLQPTSPLRTRVDIDNAFNMLQEKNADSIVSVCLASSHPYWTKKITQEGLLLDFIPGIQSFDYRQQLPAAYTLNGAIYLVRRDVLLIGRSFYSEKTFAYIMPEERSLDIDTPWDLYVADITLRERLKIMKED